MWKHVITPKTRNTQFNILSSEKDWAMAIVNMHKKISEDAVWF